MHLYSVAHFFHPNFILVSSKHWSADFFSLSKCLTNILIAGESKLDERSGQLNRGAYILKLLVM